ncbi:DUF302 domain-containing protein [soil metagenome]
MNSSDVTLAYGFGAVIDVPYDVAVKRVRDALAAEGFGVLTQIDVAATLKEKLDIDFRSYTILGACNPALAHQALSSELEIGLLLPCNVVVHAADDENGSVVSIMDPEAALSLADNQAIAPVAADVKLRLQRVLDAVRR